MSSNLNRIREALRNNKVVLSRGELRIDPQPSGKAEILPPVRSPMWDGGPAQHTTEEPTSIRLKPTTWAAPAWPDDRRYQRRLEAEVLAMKAQFPAAVLARLQDTLVWEMPVRTLSGTLYHVAVQYPSAFPLGEPVVFVLSHKLKASPHQFPDGSLCLGHAFARETSALTTAAWSAAWLSAYEVYLETGSWPEFHPVSHNTAWGE